MANMNDIVKIAVDAHKGSVEKYSVAQSQELLREALVQANGGSTVVDVRSIRDGKSAELFNIVETILGRTVVDGLMEDEFFNQLVQFVNTAEGDTNEFVIEDSDLYIVADIARGTQGIRRQRITGAEVKTIPATMKAVRIYEELSRVLAGRVDFNHMIDRVSASFRQKILTDIYAAWGKATAADFGNATYFPVAGAYDEDKLLDLVAHVEASAGGRPATILGTKKALRKAAPASAFVGEVAKTDLYDQGWFGRFYGTAMVATPQRHVAGTSTFAFNDKLLTVVAGDEKPIKCVYEGNPLIIPGNPLNNADLTQEFFYGAAVGVGVVVASGNSGIGRYEFT